VFPFNTRTYTQALVLTHMPCARAGERATLSTEAIRADGDPLQRSPPVRTITSPYLYISIPPRTLFVHIVCLYSISRHALAPDALCHIMYPYLHSHATGTLTHELYIYIRMYTRASESRGH
jgi:hypothetical protein